MAERIKVVKVETLEKPVVVEIENSLQGMYEAIGGGCDIIQAIYPFDDPVALVCDDEGKLNGQLRNRGLYDDNGRIYDVVNGTFLIIGIDSEHFCSIPDDLVDKYVEKFSRLEIWP